jgi:hypothetical protein
MQNCQGHLLGCGLYKPVFNSGRGDDIFIFSKTFSFFSGAQPAFYLMGTGGFFPVLQRPGLLRKQITSI